MKTPVKASCFPACAFKIRSIIVHECAIIDLILHLIIIRILLKRLYFRYFNIKPVIFV